MPMYSVVLLVGPGLLTLAFGAFMLQHAAFLANSSAPHGILSLQMTYAVEDARAILSSWSREEVRHAALSLYWDMGFAIAYGMFLSALSRWSLSGRSRVALVAAWIPILATIADLSENLLHLMLLDTIQNGAGILAGTFVLGGFLFASTKWCLLASWSLLFLSGLAGRAFRRAVRKPD